MCCGAVVLVVELDGAVGVEFGDGVDVVVCGLVVVAVVLGAEGWAFVVVVVGRLCRLVVVVVGDLDVVVVVGCRATVEVVAAEAEPIARANELHVARTAAATTSAPRRGPCLIPAAILRYELTRAIPRHASPRTFLLPAPTAKAPHGTHDGSGVRGPGSGVRGPGPRDGGVGRPEKRSVRSTRPCSA
jgi:hypothetical protein